MAKAYMQPVLKGWLKDAKSGRFQDVPDSKPPFPRRLPGLTLPQLIPTSAPCANYTCLRPFWASSAHFTLRGRCYRETICWSAWSLPP